MGPMSQDQATALSESTLTRLPTRGVGGLGLGCFTPGPRPHTYHGAPVRSRTLIPIGCFYSEKSVAHAVLIFSCLSSTSLSELGSHARYSQSCEIGFTSPDFSEEGTEALSN